MGENKTILDNLKEQKDILTTVISIISILVVSFLISNFVFNLGYFSLISSKFLGLLALPDYYEGTAPFLFLAGITFFVFFNATHVSFRPLLLIKDVIECFIKLIILLPLVYIYIKLKNLFTKIFLLKHMTFIKKKNYIKEKQNLLFSVSEYKKILFGFIKTSMSLTLLLLYVFYPIWLFYQKIYCVEPVIFWLIFGFWIVFILSMPFIKDNYKNIAILIMVIVLLFMAGQWMFLKNLQDTTVKIITIENKQESVVRIISKGVIVYDKETNNITFTSWEYVKSISKEIKYARNYFKNKK